MNKKLIISGLIGALALSTAIAGPQAGVNPDMDQKMFGTCTGLFTSLKSNREIFRSSESSYESGQATLKKALESMQRMASKATGYNKKLVDSASNDYQDRFEKLRTPMGFETLKDEVNSLGAACFQIAGISPAEYESLLSVK